MRSSFIVSLDESETAIVKAFDEIAKREGKDRSEVLLTFINNYVKAHNKGNPAFTLDNWEHNPNFRAFPTLGEPANPKTIETFNDAELKELLINAQSFIETVSREVEKRRPAQDHPKDLNVYSEHMKQITRRRHNVLWQDDPEYATHKDDCLTCQSIDSSTKNQNSANP